MHLNKEFKKGYIMKLSINEPCHEDWNGMLPNNDGAFCLSCQKTVIDFSKKSIHEIKDFFKAIPQSNKVCGRFKTTQLEELSFDDFFEKFKKWHLPYKLVVILIFTFGLGLFSCQTSTTQQQQIQQTPPIDSTAQTTMGAILPTTTVTSETIIPNETHTMGEIAPEPKSVIKDTIKHKNQVKIKPDCQIKGAVSINIDSIPQKNNESIKDQDKLLLGKIRKD